LKKNTRKKKIILGIKTTPYTTKIHEISKMVIRHLLPNPQDKNQCWELERTLRHLNP